MMTEGSPCQGTLDEGRHVNAGITTDQMLFYRILGSLVF